MNTQPKPPSGNFLWAAMTLAPLFFLFPVGLISFVFGLASLCYASRVKPARRAGDLQAAQTAARRSRNYGLIGLIFPVALAALLFVIASSRHFHRG